MKYGRVMEKCGMRQSLPVRGAWVEIALTGLHLL